MTKKLLTELRRATTLTLRAEKHLADAIRAMDTHAVRLHEAAYACHNAAQTEPMKTWLLAAYSAMARADSARDAEVRRYRVLLFELADIQGIRR